MRADDERVLDLTVRELLERSVRRIVAHSTRGPDFDARVDLYYDLELLDPKLGRRHRVRTRLKITAASLIFDRNPDAET